MVLENTTFTAKQDVPTCTVEHHSEIGRPESPSPRAGNESLISTLSPRDSSSVGLPPVEDNVIQIERSPTENDVIDLEDLAVAPSGPPYTAFTKNQRRWIIFMVTWAAFISPTSANIYFPAINPIARDLNVSNVLINATISSYMLFQGFAPTIFGDLADVAGRRPAYIVSFIVYIGANIGLALQTSFPALLILRCLQACGSSGAIALGIGVVADVSSSAERGEFMGIVGGGAMIAPTLSPVIGGILAQYLGWRSCFWFLVIFTGVWLVPYVLTVPETSRNVVGNGSIKPQGWNMTLIDYIRFRKEVKASHDLSLTAASEDRSSTPGELARKPKIRFPNPLKAIHIILEKDVGVVLLYNALIYTAFFDIVASMPALFAEIYGFNDLQIGLCYIPFGAGSCIAAWVNGQLLDRNYERVARKVGFIIDKKRGDDLRHFPIERARIEIVWYLLPFGIGCLFAYGWVLEKNANLAAPLVLQFLIGLFIGGSFNILSTLLVDLYPQSPATATAANNLVRCFLGAGGTGIVNIMIESMGRGWCFTFVALVCTLTMPLLWVEVKWGPGWREQRAVRLEKEAAEANRRHEVEDGLTNLETAPVLSVSVNEEKTATA